MTDNNLRQADVPEGASVIPQMPGTAPGLVCPVGDKIVYAVPGVPHEMREMLNGTVIPDLQKRAGLSAVIRSRVLRTWGQTESGLAEMLAGRIEELDAPGNPTLAFQASGIEGIKVRITAKAGSAEEAETILSGEEARLRAILGDAIFGIDNETMESVVIDMLRDRGLSLGIGIAHGRTDGCTHHICSRRERRVSRQHCVLRERCEVCTTGSAGGTGGDRTSCPGDGRGCAPGVGRRRRACDYWSGRTCRAGRSTGRNGSVFVNTPLSVHSTCYENA
jgi:hypothetical protein